MDRSNEGINEPIFEMEYQKTIDYKLETVLLDLKDVQESLAILTGDLKKEDVERIPSFQATSLLELLNESRGDKDQVYILLDKISKSKDTLDMIKLRYIEREAFHNSPIFNFAKLINILKIIGRFDSHIAAIVDSAELKGSVNRVINLSIDKSLISMIKNHSIYAPYVSKEKLQEMVSALDSIYVNVEAMLQYINNHYNLKTQIDYL